MKLPWDSKNNINTAFPIHYSKHFLTQFSQGNHSVTKAFSGYLGLTDDYDFCWGPAEEGEALPPVQAEYTERLWGVYAKTAGEIYLLKSNADLSGWEREELLTYVPSGSQKPSIVFNTEGRYEVAVEFIPAGSEIEEVWLFSYPYEGAAIRKISDGTEPVLFMDHNQEVVIFYTTNDHFQIKYRLMSENFATERGVDIIYQPERTLHLKEAFKFYKPFNPALDVARKYFGYVLLFYSRDDDIYPLKYALTDVQKTYPVIQEQKPTPEKTGLNVALSGINWLNIVAGQLTPLENTDLSIALSGLSWQEILTIMLTPQETTDLDVTLSGINWMEISFINRLYSENTLISIGLDAILWVEV